MIIINIYYLRNRTRQLSEACILSLFFFSPRFWLLSIISKYDNFAFPTSLPDWR